jgi:dynein heavy chain
VTPTSYLELIKTFKDLLEKKRLEIIKLRERYIVGIEKLELSENQIGVMQKELNELKPKMVKASKETEELIVVIEKEAGEVDAVKQIVEADKEQANKATMEAQFIKDECEEALDMAMPALNDAVAALNTLKPQDISCSP